MRKNYVKPEAVSVAFTVNENIASSGLIPGGSSGGIYQLVNHSGGNCNHYLANTGIETNLKEGCIDIEHLMNHISTQPDEKYVTDLGELQAILDGLHHSMKAEDFNCNVI